MTNRIGKSSPQPTTRPAEPLPAKKASTPEAAAPAAGWGPKASTTKPASYDAASATLEQLRRSLPAQAFDLKTPATRPAGALTTGVGAKCSVALDAFQPQMTPSGYVMPYKLSVTYEDKAGYFQGAKSVKAWTQLTGTDGAVAATLDNLTLERQADGRYVGTAFVTQKAVGSAGLRDAALAFNAAGKWDSNQSQNYRFGL